MLCRLVLVSLSSSQDNIAAAVIIASSSPPCPLSSRCPPPAFVAASAMTWLSLSSPQPPPHHRTTTSSVAIAMVGRGAMDGGTAATATPSHSHHLKSPLCHAPPSHIPPNVDCCVLPLLRQQCADINTLTLSSPRQRATAPPPPPFNKILSIEKRRQTTGDSDRLPAIAWDVPSTDAGVGGEAMESISVGGERAKNGRWQRR